MPAVQERNLPLWVWEVSELPSLAFSRPKVTNLAFLKSVGLDICYNL